MFYEVKKEEITTALIQRLHKGFHPIYNSAGIDGFSHAILEKLDSGNYQYVRSDGQRITHQMYF